MVSTNQSKRYSRWGQLITNQPIDTVDGAPQRVLERFGGVVGESDPAGLAVPPTALPARPVNGLSLPSFLCCLFGGQVCRPNPIFSHIESAHSQLKKSALTHSAHL